MTVIIGYTRINEEGLQETAIVHDSAVTDRGYLMTDMNRLPGGKTVKDDALNLALTGTGVFTMTSAKSRKFIERIKEKLVAKNTECPNATVEDIETSELIETIISINREFFKDINEHTDEDTCKQLNKSNDKIVAMCGHRLFEWFSSTISPFLTVDGICFAGSGDEAAIAAYSMWQIVQQEVPFKKGKTPTHDQVMKMVIMAACNTVDSCRPPVVMHKLVGDGHIVTSIL